MISIHNNFESVRLSRHISNRLGSLKLTFGRISTGLRINSSGDDAAGMQIRDRLSKQIIEAQAEIKNITDEVSLLQVANGALSESLGALQRMRELAVSAANETLSLEERGALEQEFKALMTHIDEIAEDTTFNGKKILSRDASQLRLSLLGDDDHVDDALSTMLLPTLDTRALGKQARYQSARRGVFLGPLESGDLTINGVEVRGTTRFDDALSYSHAQGSALAKAKAINAITQHTGVRAIVDENVIQGRESIRELELDETKWFKINGYMMSGFKIEENDASQALRQQINALHAYTGVEAIVDNDGKLILSAHDGRNITIEYSDGDVRDALRIVDLFGDPINLSDTVDPAEFSSDGDIDGITADVSAAGFSASIAPNPAIAGDQSGQYGGHRDLVDFVIEVVKPGPLGTATYRIKQEDTDAADGEVAIGTRDATDSSEDYVFNDYGLKIQHDPNKLLDNATNYEGASTREVQVVVTEPGNPYGTGDDRPLANIFLYNTDTGLNDAQVLNTRIQAGTIRNDFFADYGISFVPTNSTYKYYQSSNGAKQNFHRLNLGLDHKATGDQYPYLPFISRWYGELKTDFEVVVEESGHAISTADPAGTAAEPAKITVKADIHRDGAIEQKSITFTLTGTSSTNASGDGTVGYDATNGVYYVNFSDKGAGTVVFGFPRPTSQLFNSTTGPTWLTTSGYDLTPSFDRAYYVGDEDRTYSVKFTSDGAFTSALGDGPSADLYADGVKVHSIPEVNLGFFELLGPGAVYEGLELAMQGPRIDSQNKSVAHPTGNTVGFSIGSYTGENQTVTVEVVEGGDTFGSDVAKFKYTYQDGTQVISGGSPANASFQVSGGVTLPDGLRISGSASTNNSVSNISSSLGTNYLQRISSSSGASAYTRGKIGEMTATLSGTTTEPPSTFTVLSTGRVEHQEVGGAEVPVDYSSGGAALSAGDISVTDGYKSGGAYGATQDFYVFFRDGKTYLTTGSDSDVDSGTILTSNGTSGSNTFTINGSSFTVSYNPSLVDDDVDISGSDTQVTGFKLRLSDPAPVYDYDLNVSWSFEDGSTDNSIKILDVQNKLNQSLDLGYGIKARLNSSAVNTTPLQDGRTFKLTATPLNLKTGDTFKATLESRVHAGDEVQVTAKAKDLVEGTSWSVTGHPPLWELGDEFKITYQHNFESPELTLGSSLSYTPGPGIDSMGTLNLSAAGDFKTGDTIKVKTRSFLGEVSSSGVYTETLYPTDYILTVTQGGDISEGVAGAWGPGGDTVTVEWVRADGRSAVDDVPLPEGFFDKKGASSFTLTAADLGRAIELEEGVYVTFDDVGQGAYLATGDVITIPVGQKLFYTFSGGITLQSEENIDLSYSSSEVDNLMGRMLFVGPEDISDTQLGADFSLEAGLLGKNNDFSVRNTGLLTNRQINEAIDTIDVAINQLSHSMTQISAVSQRAIHRIENLNQRALDLMMVRSRIQDADMAQETALMASEQIKLMSAPLLMDVSNSEALTVLDLIRQDGRRI